MAYTKRTWQNNESGGTPITADSLNHMETGIGDAHELLGKLPPKMMFGATSGSITIPARTSQTGSGKVEVTRNFNATKNSNSPSNSFGIAPMVFLQITGAGGTNVRGLVSAFVASTTTTDMVVELYNYSNGDIAVNFNWIAIGA